jgi:hypothetical protein
LTGVSLSSVLGFSEAFGVPSLVVMMVWRV